MSRWESHFGNYMEKAAEGDERSIHKSSALIKREKSGGLLLNSSPGDTNIRRGSTGSMNPPTWAARNSIGSPWTVQMSYLKNSSNTKEVSNCLKTIDNQLANVDSRDRIKLCKGPFESAVKYLQSRRKGLVTSDISQQINYILINYFNESTFKILPENIIIEIFMWIPTDEFAQVLPVSREFFGLGTSDILWKNFYLYKFQRHNPNSMPSAKSEYKELYRTRLDDPEIGDRVEVSWQGKFRLEALEVYQGRAWWVAEIVDKHTAQGRYKIRYPGWDSRWDEWVSRNRLRWAVDRNLSARINSNDVVELWCFGSNVPGAWLEAKIKKVRNNKFCVGKVLSTGSLWVDRERLRPVKRPPRDMIEDASDMDSPRGRRNPYILSERLTGCSIM